MKKTKKQHEEDIVRAIKDNKVMFIQHIFGVYGELRSRQFYKLGLHESDAILSAIRYNRILGCNFMLNKWIASENPTLQIAAYRLICSDDERRNLNQAYIDHTTKGASLNKEREMTPKEAAEFIKELKRTL